MCVYIYIHTPIYAYIHLYTHVYRVFLSEAQYEEQPLGRPQYEERPLGSGRPSGVARRAFACVRFTDVHVFVML